MPDPTGEVSWWAAGAAELLLQLSWSRGWESSAPPTKFLRGGRSAWEASLPASSCGMRMKSNVYSFFRKLQEMQRSRTLHNSVCSCDRESPNRMQGECGIGNSGRGKNCSKGYKTALSGNCPAPCLRESFFRFLSILKRFLTFSQQVPAKLCCSAVSLTLGSNCHCEQTRHASWLGWGTGSQVTGWFPVCCLMWAIFWWELYVIYFSLRVLLTSSPPIVWYSALLSHPGIQLDFALAELLKGWNG